MKNLFKITFTVSASFAALIFNPLRAQTNVNTADSLHPIPVEVLAVFQKGCFDCHAEPGKAMAMSHVNFTKWNEYTTAQKAEKAKAISDEVNAGKMPPKRYKEYNPASVPTAEELQIINNWIQKLAEN